MLHPVGDFSAQAVVNTILSRAFPGDKIVGEEDASELRDEANATLRGRVVELANQALASDLVPGDNVQWGIGPNSQRSTDELLDAIDRGNFEGGSKGRTSFILFVCTIHIRQVFNHGVVLKCRYVDIRSY